MNISQTGLNLIKEFEGCRLSAYKDSVGVVTIGWGTTNSDSSIIGTTIHMGMKITQAQADDWLEKSVNKKYVPKVMKYDSIYHWNQNQLDALTSFAYNIGSIDQLTNNGKRTIEEIANKILAYDKAGGKVLAGLTRRRKAEKALFETPVAQLKGWICDSKGWRYKADEGYYVNCWKQINNEWYYFKADSYIATEEYIKASDYDTSHKLYWVDDAGQWNNKAYRWLNNEVGWWLAEIDGKWYAQNEWAKVDGAWYYFDDEGYMIHNRIITIDGQVCQFDSEGKLI